MTTLKQPSPKNQKLATEWARQYVVGEIYAKYWQWSYVDEKNNVGGGVSPTLTPNWYEGCTFSYAPAPAHPHYAIYKEWEAYKASGAVERGEYKLRGNFGVNDWSYAGGASLPSWDVNYGYAITKTDKHPDNCKPKLKLIDWSKVPIGTMTDGGEVIKLHALDASHVAADVFYCHSGKYGKLANHPSRYLRIVPTKKWTAIQDGEQPPVCEGLVIEYRFVSFLGIFSRAKTLPDDAIGIAYRVIGLAEGYKDSPELAV